MILAAMLLMLAGATDADARVIRVLAIGNSFSQDAVEQYLYELAAAQGDSLVIGNAYIGGCSIDRHYENLMKGTAEYEYRKILGGVRANRKRADLRSIIRDEQWDVITLQQASPLSGMARSYANLGQLKRLVQSYTSNLHVEFAWHMTWAYADSCDHKGYANYGHDQRRMYDAIAAAVQQVMPAVGISRVIPSGTAIQLVRYRLGDIVCRDGYHLSLTVGRYTAACTWCEMLTGRIVEGNTFRPEGMTEEEVLTCQQEAHEACYTQRRGRYLVF